MDSNNAKQVPVLESLVSTSSTPSKSAAKPTAKISTPKLTPMDGNSVKPAVSTTPVTQTAPRPATPISSETPNNRRTNKSHFEIELNDIVNRIMLKHFESASEEIVQEVLSQVRARLPGQRRD